ncbi:MAG: YncE family protein [Bryobacteraceae bacterium]
MKRLIYFLLAACAAFAADGYQVKQKIKIGGSGVWGYLTMDESARRLYIANESRAVVVDVDSGKVVGEIPDTPGIHGIAVAPALGKGFTSNGKGNNVTIFDLKTLKPLGEARTGKDPDTILFESKTGRVFSFNNASFDVTAIDANTGDVVGTTKLGGKPTGAVTDGSGKIWFSLQTTTEDWSVVSELGMLDAASLKVAQQNPTAPCDAPMGLAMDVKNRRLFAACGNKQMAVIDADSGSVIGSVPTGAGSAGAGFDPNSGVAFAANGGEGTLTVITESGGKYEAAQKVQTARGARTMAVDPKTGNVYLPAVEYESTPAAPVVPDSFMLLVVGK